MPWCQTPSRKKAIVFTTVTTSAYQDQLNTGVSKVCEIFKVCGIVSLKYVLEFYTQVSYCDDISTPRNVTLNETSCNWLFDMSVKRPHGQWLPWIPDLKPSVWRSGYARLGAYLPLIVQLLHSTTDLTHDIIWSALAADSQVPLGPPDTEMLGLLRVKLIQRVSRTWLGLGHQEWHSLGVNLHRVVRRQVI